MAADLLKLQALATAVEKATAALRKCAKGGKDLVDQFKTTRERLKPLDRARQDSRGASGRAVASLRDSKTNTHIAKANAAPAGAGRGMLNGLTQALRFGADVAAAVSRVRALTRPSKDAGAPSNNGQIAQAHGFLAKTGQIRQAIRSAADTATAVYRGLNRATAVICDISSTFGAKPNNVRQPAGKGMAARVGGKGRGSVVRHARVADKTPGSPKRGALGISGFQGKLGKLSSTTGSLSKLLNNKLNRSLSQLTQTLAHLLPGLTSWLNKNPALSRVLHTLSGAIASVQGVISNLAAALDAVATLLRDLSKAVKTSKTLFKELAGPVSKLAGLFKGGFARAADRLKTLFLGMGQAAQWLGRVLSGGFIRVLRILKIAFLGVGRALLWLGTALLENPIILIIAAIAVAALLIWKYWKPITAWLVKVWDDVAGALKAVWDWIKSLFASACAAVAGVVGRIWHGMVKRITAIWDGFKQYLSGVFDVIAGLFSGDWGRVKKGLSTALQGLMAIVTGLFGQLPGQLIAWGKKAWHGLTAGLSATWTWIKSTFARGCAVVAGLVSRAWQGMVARISGIWNGFKQCLSGVFDVIAGLFSGYWGRVKGGLGKLLHGLGAMFKGFFGKLPAQFMAWGKHIIDALISGIKAKAKAVKKALTGVFGSIGHWFKHLPGIDSAAQTVVSHKHVIVSGTGQHIQRALPGATARRRAIGAGLALGGLAAAPAFATTVPPAVVVRQAPRAPAGENPVTIHVHGAPGMDERALAAEVARQLQQHQQRQAARQRAQLGDID